MSTLKTDSLFRVGHLPAFYGTSGTKSSSKRREKLDGYREEKCLVLRKPERPRKPAWITLRQ